MIGGSSLTNRGPATGSSLRWQHEVARTRRPARIALLLLPLALLLAFTGCLSRPALLCQTFALQSPAPTGAAAAKGDCILTLRTVEVSPLFQGRSLTYRTGADSYELDAYASFLVPPNRALAIPLCAYLRNSGAFQGVVEPGSLLVANTFLEVHVGELYGDFRQADKPAAVLSIRLLLFRGGNQKGPELLFQKDYSRSIALPAKTAAAVVAAWDKALAEIMAEATSDLAAAK